MGKSAERCMTTCSWSFDWYGRHQQMPRTSQSLSDDMGNDCFVLWIL